MLCLLLARTHTHTHTCHYSSSTYTHSLIIHIIHASYITLHTSTRTTPIHRCSYLSRFCLIVLSNCRCGTNDRTIIINWKKYVYRIYLPIRICGSLVCACLSASDRYICIRYEHTSYTSICGWVTFLTCKICISICIIRSFKKTSPLNTYVIYV